MQHANKVLLKVLKEFIMSSCDWHAKRSGQAKQHTNMTKWAIYRVYLLFDLGETKIEELEH